MAAVRELDLLSRLAAGTAGVLGEAFLRRLVAELAGTLGAEVAFVAELLPEARARTIASAGPLPVGHVFDLAGTPCEDAYCTPLLLIAEGARARYPQDAFLAAHGLDGYLAVALHDARGEAIGHLGVIASDRLDPDPSELHALQVFAARAGAELERRRHEESLAATRERALAAADEERRRIGRDLHDGAQQRLVVLGQALDLALRDLERDPQLAVARLSAAREQAAVASQELRRLAQGLHPVGPLRSALAGLAIQSSLPLYVEALPEQRLPDVIEATIWFLVSESLSNAIKHSGATELRVRVVAGDDIAVTVADDGVGGACETRGTGLRGLRARVESLGGSLSVACEGGTTLTARLPLR